MDFLKTIEDKSTIEFYKEELKYFQNNWELFRDYSLAIPNSYFRKFNKKNKKEINQIYKTNKEGLGLCKLFYKNKFEKSIFFWIKHYKLYKLINKLNLTKVSNIMVALYEPNVETYLHTDNTPFTIRSHLGLDVPEDSGIIVNENDMTVKSGEISLFYADQKHRAWNHSNQNRYILIIDFFRPEYDSRNYN